MAEFASSRNSKGQRTPTMQTELKRQTTDASIGTPLPAIDETRELALLAEFMRHDSVASLAGEIAERLGANV